MLRDNASLQDILKAGEKIASFSREFTIEDLVDDDMHLSAILYEFIIIGEASRRLSNELRDKHPEIPWKKMVGMRNILTHQSREFYALFRIVIADEAIRSATGFAVGMGMRSR